MQDIAIAIHGGAGDLPAARLTVAQQADYKRGLTAAITSGYALLQQGASAVEAVAVAVAVLEDDPLFNAGHGAVLCRNGRVELDASIMDGRDARAAAVAVVKTTQHPIHLAQSLLEHQHVFMVAEAADQMAQQLGMAQVSNDFFITPYRQEQWSALAAQDTTYLDHESGGTVGAVARDHAGNLAAATSTGGMMNQLPGRVGDSAIIGAGTWAENDLVAISATGSGEMFMRSAFAYHVAAQMRLAGMSVNQAAGIALERVAALGGKGGCILMPASGPAYLPKISQHMLRAWVTADGVVHCAIADEEI